MTRILVTSSRTWADVVLIHQAIMAEVRPGEVTTIVHGGCSTGGDRWADLIAVVYEFTREVHPANWRPGGIYNRAAGIIRNQEMVDLGADVCLAFIRDGSRGASYTAAAAEAAGIPTRRFTA